MKNIDHKSNGPNNQHDCEDRPPIDNHFPDPAYKNTELDREYRGVR